MHDSIMKQYGTPGAELALMTYLSTVFYDQITLFRGLFQHQTESFARKLHDSQAHIEVYSGAGQ